MREKKKYENENVLLKVTEMSQIVKLFREFMSCKNV